MVSMPTLTLALQPQLPALDLLGEPQACYVLLRLGARGAPGALPVSWALVADASRSMRIPIVDEQQFRELVRSGGAQETLVDGVPVWQLNGAVPAEVRAASPSPLEHVARALHTVVEQLDAEDRFALIACAERAVLMAPGATGAERASLVRGIARLSDVDLGDRTDLARGLELALHELRSGRRRARAERILLLTDGFTERADACLALAEVAAAEHVAISTVGLGGEFQEALLTELADRSGGQALFLPSAAEIPRAVAAELEFARSVAARGVSLRVQPAPGVALRRVTRVRPALAVLHERQGDSAAEVVLGDLPTRGEALLLLELVAPPREEGVAPLASVLLSAEDAPPALAEVSVRYRRGAAPLDGAVRDAAARASVARLQRRAVAPATPPAEAARLLRTGADRLDELGEHALAAIAREQAAAVERSGRAAALATKELTYATRRLGEVS
jgi:hypothetical protein